MTRSEGDAALLEKIRTDAPGAFDEFVSRWGGRIYGFGFKVCGQREDARDVLQETLIKAYESLKGLREPRALRSWLYRVASNACLMQRRKGKFEPDRELSLDELIPGDGEHRLEIPDLSRAPDRAAVRRELQAAVREAVESLPTHYRVVVVLRDMEQLSTREVSDALGLPETTIKMRLHRGRLAVRQALERKYGRELG